MVSVDLGDGEPAPPALLPGCAVLEPRDALVLGPTVAGRPVLRRVTVTNCTDRQAQVSVRVDPADAAFRVLDADGNPVDGPWTVRAGGPVEALVEFGALAAGQAVATLRVEVGPGWDGATLALQGSAVEAPEVMPAFPCAGAALRRVPGSMLVGPDTNAARPETVLAIHGVAPGECFEVEEDVVILGTPLENLSVLAGLVRVGRSLFVGHELGGNARLQDVDGLANLRAVDGDLVVRDNPRLRNLDGLMHVAELGGSLVLRDNALVPDVAGLSALREVPGELLVRNHRRLRNLRGLRGVTRVGGALRVVGNLLLQDLDGLSGVTSVGGAVGISFNGALKTLAGLSGITRIPGQLGVEGNATLSSLEGLQALASADEVLVAQNPQLQDLLGLSFLSAARLLVISGNPRLRSTAGLRALREVTRDLVVDSNHALEVLGLESLERVGNRLSIRANPLLSTAEATALSDRVAPAVVDIRDNGEP